MNMRKDSPVGISVFKVNNRNKIKDFTHCPVVFTVDFEQENTEWFGHSWVRQLCIHEKR